MRERRNRAPQAVRRGAGASTVLRAVLDHGPVARSTVARLTGLSPAAVTGHSAQLARLGLLRELPEQVQSRGVGRPHVPVEVDTSRHLACAVHIAVQMTTTALLDLHGRVVAQHQEPHVRGETDPARVVRRASDRLAALLGEHGGGREPIGLGVATGGWVDRDTGTVVEHPVLGWQDVPLRELLARQTGLPVYVDGHSRALLHAERLFGAARRVGGVLHLFVGNVVDAAFATDDLAHYGPRSQSGAVAHMPVAGGTERCACGRSGCLQAAVSELTLARRAAEEGVIAAPDFALLLKTARGGDRRAVRLFVERARLVGRAASMLMDVFNPELTVVVEAGVAYLPEALHALRAEVAEHGFNAADAAHTVVPTSFPDAVLATAGGAVILDVLYRDPLGQLGKPDRLEESGRLESSGGEQHDLDEVSVR